ncbi:diguanylate cyclase domain-containing protein [Actinoplanes sp. NPDC051859]|uniref:diguanylate cyclase domain-containing protein n=1 Tax=Actinoplanes sp. NPDC051859 TaxID=3363909 RepID=UPI0037B40E5A
MTDTIPDAVLGTDSLELDQLRTEVQRLRAQITASQTTSARALSRATRLAQVVSVLGQLTDVDDIFARAAGEVAELFAADIALFWLVRDGRTELAGSWGVPAHDLTADAAELPPGMPATTGAAPLIAGAVDRVPVPSWLAAYDPRHVVWARLATGDETLGYMLLIRRTEAPFDSADALELRAVATRVALAVENGRLQRRTHAQLQQLHRLHELTAQLVGMLDLTEVVPAIARIVTAEVPVEGTAVYLQRGAEFPVAAIAGTGLTGLDPATPGVRVLRLSAGGKELGLLAVRGAPPVDSEADALLRHLADLAALVISKALLFERVSDQANRDPLTRLANRALFMERLEQAVAHAQSTGGSVGVIFADLDKFKAVNDTYGHDVGDALLIGVAQRLAGAIRPADLLARLGGDEFVVLCEELPGPREARAVTRHLAQTLAPPFDIGGTRLVAGSSFGVALTDEVGYDAEALLRAADEAMYRAKGSGSRGLS